MVNPAKYLDKVIDGNEAEDLSHSIYINALNSFNLIDADHF